MNQDILSFLAIVGVLAVIMVPRIIRTLAKHQQEMAVIVRSDNLNQQLETEVRELRNQVAKLNEIVTNHILSAPSTPSVQARIGEQELKQ